MHWNYHFSPVPCFLLSIVFAIVKLAFRLFIVRFIFYWIRYIFAAFKVSIHCSFLGEMADGTRNRQVIWKMLFHLSLIPILNINPKFRRSVSSFWRWFTTRPTFDGCRSAFLWSRPVHYQKTARDASPRIKTRDFTGCTLCYIIK